MYGPADPSVDTINGLFVLMSVIVRFSTVRAKHRSLFRSPSDPSTALHYQFYHLVAVPPMAVATTDCPLW